MSMERRNRGQGSSLLLPPKRKIFRDLAKSLIGFTAGVLFGLLALTVGMVGRILWNGIKDFPGAFAIMMAGALLVGYARFQLLG